MNPKELENALANNAIINKFMSNGNADEQVHTDIKVDDLHSKISIIEKLHTQNRSTTASIRKDIDDLLINKNLINDDLRMQLDKLEVTVTQLYANQAVLMDWVKANTSKEKELLRQELPTSKEDTSKELAYKEFMGTADKYAIKTPKPKFSDTLNIKLLKIKDWVEHMFKSQNKIYSSDLKELAQIEGILWSHVHLVKNYFMDGRIKIDKVGSGANQKWQWQLKEEV